LWHISCGHMHAAHGEIHFLGGGICVCCGEYECCRERVKNILKNDEYPVHTHRRYRHCWHCGARPSRASLSGAY
jgi:hypothetical protein